MSLMWKLVTRSLIRDTFKVSALQRNIHKHRVSSCRHNSVTSTDEVLVEKLGPVTTIGINRPHKRNCVNRVTANKLSKAFLEFEEDDSALVGVVHGTGGYFCAGLDLKELSELNLELGVNDDSGNGPMGPSRRMIKKPLVAAVNGYAVAGGLELALLCDLRVMEESATMGVFCRRFGVPLVDGGTVRLQALVGLSRALDLILTGRPIKGPEAFEWGLANRLVATGTALEEAINLANSLVKFPQACLRADRVAAYNTAFNASSFEEALEFEKKNIPATVLKEAVTGATKFASGVGRHGKFSDL